MSTPDPQINLNGLDFDQIKQSIINFLKTKPEFEGYNFEGSNLNILMEVLAYHAAMNGYLTHALQNEMFLESAQDRRSVVSHAKTLGYIPSSVRSSTAVVKFSQTNSSGSIQTIPRGSAFSMKVAGTDSVQFVTVDDVDVPTGTNDIQVTLKEGNYREVSYIIPPISPQASIEGVSEIRLVIPNKDFDETTLKVFIEDSVGFVSEYTRQENVVNPVFSSGVFWIQENSDGNYEVILNRFTRNNAGATEEQSLKKATFNFVVSSGEEQNDLFYGVSPTAIKVQTPSLPNTILLFSEFIDFPFGGKGKESIESIRFYAPREFQAQNRAVTVEDYRNLIESRVQGIESIRVVGGETLTPPRYGRVFVSQKFKNRTTMPETAKTEIASLLRDFGMVTVAPEFKEPDYVYVIPSVSVKYNNRNRNVSGGVVNTRVKDQIQLYNDEQLNKFDADLWVTALNDYIQQADSSIVSIDTRVRFEKRLLIEDNVTIFTGLNFGNTILETTLKSSIFQMVDPASGQTRDCYVADDSGSLFIYWDRSGVRTRLANIGEIGTIDYDSGVVQLVDFRPLSTSEDILTFSVSGSSSDVEGKDDLIVTIDESLVETYVQFVNP